MRAIRSPQILLLGLCLIAGLLAFSPNLNSYFLSDDFVQIGKVLHGDYAVAWGQEHGGFFRPLFIWSYVFDSRIWGARPLGYHLTNVILHGLNTFLVFKFAESFLRPVMHEWRERSIVAASAAAFFLLHPSHSEAVVWISGRADLLATFLVLAALTSFVSYEERPRMFVLILSLGCFIAALLAKESAICTPLLILLIGISRRTKPRLLLSVFGIFAATLGVFVLIRAYVIGSIIGGYGTAQHLNFSPGWLRDRLLEASVRSVVPPLPTSWFGFLDKPLQSPRFYLIVFLVLAGIAVAIKFRRQQYSREQRNSQSRTLITCCGLFLISLLPAINLRLYLHQTLGERFIYLPTVFMCIMLAYVARILIRREKVFLMFLGLALCFNAVSLYRTGRLWGEAAHLTYSIVGQLTNSASQPSVTVMNTPDNLRGVPVFHNGLPEALRWFRPEKPIAEVQIVAFQDLQSSSDEMLIRYGNPLTMRASNPSDKFNRITSGECFEASSPAADMLNLQPKPCAAPAEFFFFSNGRIERLKDAGAN